MGFNFSDKRNGVYFVSRGPNDLSAAAALAECNPPIGVDATECDIWFMADPNGGTTIANDDTPWTSFINPAGGPPGTPYSGALMLPFDGGSTPVTAMPGAPARMNFQQTALHEVGHTLGLWHIVEPGTVIPSSCDAETTHCPVMTARTMASSYWPQFDDFEGMRDAHGLAPRELEWSVWSINGGGQLTARSSWRPFKLKLYSETPPRIACAPNGGSRKNSCIMAIGRPGKTPIIRGLSLSNSGFTVTASPAVTKGTQGVEHAVDISYGNRNRFLAIAKRHTHNEESAAIVTFSGNVGDAGANTQVHDEAGTTNGFFTHTEPRVSYHETSCHFVAAWPERNGAVHVATFGLNGRLKDDFLTDVYTRTPVELACDAHLPSEQPNCRLYVKTNDGSQEDRQSRWQTFQVPINDGGAPADSCQTDGTFSGRGDITLTSLTPAQGTWSQSNRKDALLIDTTTYGNGAEQGDLDGDAYLLSSDASPYSSMNQKEVRIRIDSDGVSAGDISSTSLSMKDTGAIGLSNTTSWGWNEAGGRLIAVRTARMKF